MSTQEKTSITKILFRRGTTAERLTADLSLGEPGWDITQKKLYIGSGDAHVPAIPVEPGQHIKYFDTESGGLGVDVESLIADPVVSSSLLTTVNNSIDYTSVPIATRVSLGTVKIGTGLNINADGVLSVSDISTATRQSTGVVQVGAGLSVTSDGLLSADLRSPAIATGSTPGIIQPSTGLQVDSNGSLSIDQAALTTLVTTIIDNTGGNSSDIPQMHAYYIRDFHVGTGRLSVSDFTEGIDTTTDLSARIDQAAINNGFQVFKSPSNGTCFLEVDAAVQDRDSDSGDAFQLHLKTCTAAGAANMTRDGVEPTGTVTLSTGCETGGSSTVGGRGSSRVKYQAQIAVDTYFYLQIDSISDGSICATNATIKITTYQ